MCLKLLVILLKIANVCNLEKKLNNIQVMKIKFKEYLKSFLLIDSFMI